jgi:hypothetical protein
MTRREDTATFAIQMAGEMIRPTSYSKGGFSFVFLSIYPKVARKGGGWLETGICLAWQSMTSRHPILQVSSALRLLYL